MATTGIRTSIWTRIPRVRALDLLKRWPVIPGAIILGMLVLAVFAPWIAPRHPNRQSLTERLAPPAWEAKGSAKYLLGTDTLGRDVLSRLIHGARISMTVAACALALGGAIGLAIGIVSGYMRGAVDMVLMRIVDSFIAVPGVLIALLFAVTMGPGLMTVVLAISLFTWATFARVIRSEVLALRERDHVALAKVHGCSMMRIMIAHILPGVMSTWMVLATLDVGRVIITEATLSFLNAGIPPPNPSWGQMISEGRAFVATAWWLAIMPGICITLMVLSFNQFGDWLRDFLDPKLRALR